MSIYWKQMVEGGFFHVARWQNMPTALRDVRYQGRSGNHLLALSFSAFDP
jgi:hypothetical protein